MTKEVGIGRTGRGVPWRILGWGMAAFLLLVPVIVMQFTNDIGWSRNDFILAAAVIAVVGGGFELAVRTSRNPYQRAAVASALAAAFMVVGANAVVGMIGDEDNRYNMLFLAVIGLALIGALVARFRPAGMAVAMLAAGVAQIAIAVGGMSTDLRGGLLSVALAGLWLLSALLFRKAAADRTLGARAS